VLSMLIEYVLGPT